ncbi:histone-lysine N-methyltransferase 2D [Biomphalaria pfeifferi]|uniref:Histone-lysine N-methyltransferase 2D n=1 Tax=Biomphalaria pfeifferi TaxID=112525 RepID=A0AAD8FE57_BIOPF|nr:histone-lysine N-methyltransferase 2D [Biomphalaria pfeifferi]
MRDSSSTISMAGTLPHKINARFSAYKTDKRFIAQNINARFFAHKINARFIAQNINVRFFAHKINARFIAQNINMRFFAHQINERLFEYKMRYIFICVSVSLNKNIGKLSVLNSKIDLSIWSDLYGA